MVVAGGQRVALPLAQVRRILRTSREELTMVGDSPMLILDDAPQPVRRLAEALGAPSEVVDEWPQQLLVAVVALGDGHTPLLVDEILGQHEAVVKAPAPPFDVLPGLAGTSVLGNGDVLLVLNVLELFGERVAPSTGLLPAPSAGAETWDEEPVDATGPLATPTVLVVDDSLSVRRVVSRTLTQHGWHVQEARDGLQALSMLRESRPDIMLLDVEMPRMDGFELTTTLKRDDTLRDLPIVMLTSRGGDKHRQKAADLGVDAYLVKPYQEATLLATLRRYARSSPRVSA
jgi:chemosensory pili system protein ChpA (sensor histidine kinase/response regulator)